AQALTRRPRMAAGLQSKAGFSRRTEPRLLLRIPATSYSPTRRPCSTIGAGGLNYRVRDGNGCVPSAIATGNSESWRTIAHGRIWLVQTHVVAAEESGQAARPISTG